MAGTRHGGGSPVAVGHQLGLSLELVQISLVTHVHLPRVAQPYPAGNGSPCLRSADRTGQGSRPIDHSHDAGDVADVEVVVLRPEQVAGYVPGADELDALVEQVGGLVREAAVSPLTKPA